jgi:hypothetical protein
MLTILIDFYYLKACHGPDHLIRIIKYHRKQLLSLNPASYKIETQGRFFMAVASVSEISSPKQITSALVPFLLSCLLSELQKPPPS